MTINDKDALKGPQPGEVWRDNNPRASGAEFVIDEIVTRGGTEYAKGIRTQTGRKVTIRTTRLKGSGRTGFTRTA